MESTNKPQEADTSSKVMGEIVGYLKHYPFLLISVAGLLILAGILIFDKAKLEMFQWLIYAVVLVPIGCQFMLECRKQGSRTTPMATPVAASMAGAQPVPLQPQHFSRKVIASLALLGLLLLAFGGASPEDIRDRNFHIGALVVLSIPALMLSFSAMSDARHGRVKGQGWAIASVALSTLMIFSSLGWMTDVNFASAPALSAAVKPSAPLPGEHAQPQPVAPIAAVAPIASHPAPGQAPADATPAADERTIALLFRQSEQCAREERWRCVIENSDNILELAPGNGRAIALRREAVRRREEALAGVVVE